MNCDDPTLLAWLGWVESFARLLGLPYDTQTALDLTQCSSRWSPLAIGAAVAGVAVVSLLLLLAILKSFLRYGRCPAIVCSGTPLDACKPAGRRLHGAQQM